MCSISILCSLIFSLPSVIKEINANYSKIETLSGRITRRYKIGQEKHKTIGKFYFKSPAKLFVKYTNPEKTFILNDTLLWIYSPEKKEAIKINYKNLPYFEKQSFGIEVFFGFNPLSGLEESFDFKLSAKGGSASGGKDNILIAKPNHTPKFISKIIFELDTKRNLIINTKLFNLQDSLIAETSYNDWENQEGVWFPQDITSKIYIEGKEIIEKIGFHELVINYTLEDKYFDFTPPQGVEIIEQ